MLFLLFVIGIVLILFGFGYVLFDNLCDFGCNVFGVQQISLFMYFEVSWKDVGEIENCLCVVIDGKWYFVLKEEVLKWMQKSEGMVEIVVSLLCNLLFDVFIVELSNIELEVLEILCKEIVSWLKVVYVQFDLVWVKCFDVFLKFG